MVALWNRADHYISALWFLSFFYLFSSPNLSRCLPYFETWCGLSATLECRYQKMLQAARWKYRTQKWCTKSPSDHHRTLCRAISSQLRHVSTIGKTCAVCGTNDLLFFWPAVIDYSFKPYLVCSTLLESGGCRSWLAKASEGSRSWSCASVMGGCALQQVSVPAVHHWDRKVAHHDLVAYHLDVWCGNYVPIGTALHQQ